ncbi:MAG: FHA domain-containing protein [Chloroflexi bacterium]|nr:FHA domain-containing protein [Chloroflexota bacterium]
MNTKPLAAGTVLKGKYRITRLIAGGGMAWVYEVEEQRGDGQRHVWALKELRADADDTHTLEEARQLFESEANILVRLSHPNLPTVSAFFEEGGRSYLVMEFIHGESLEKRLEQANAPLLEGQVLDWAVQICEVLHYLHTRPQPVIFRDMKPSNVMVTPEGRIKLIDFGIARTYKAGKRKDTITMGSENYAAPEQWGKAQTDARADIYGVGATMYHLLTKVPPLPAFVPTPRVPIQQYNPAISEATAAVVERAMADDRQERYPSAKAMQEALLDCLPRRERSRVLLSLQQTQVAIAPAPPPRATPEAVEVAPKAVPSVQGRELPGEGAAQLKYCSQCGTPNRRSARFCRRCGYAFVLPLPPVLALVEPQGAGWELPIRDGSMVIGRQGGRLPVQLDLGFYDPKGYVSRNHARIRADRRRYEITDLGSANGTYVNGEPLQPHVPRLLRQGDQIRMGRVVMQFRIR